MLLRNNSTVSPVLARGTVDEDLGVGAVLVESVYAVGRDGSLLRLESCERTTTDPPPPARIPVWHGASVTAWGTVRGGAKSRLGVELHVGEAITRLVVSGPRRWRRTSAGLRPSEPGPIGDLELGFDRAFGGAYLLPPGLLGDLPHPGFEVAYPLNPSGVGFYESEVSAEGGDLAHIELEQALIQRWGDRPEPGGLTPCPALAGLRAPAEDLVRAEPLVAMLRSHHHAPGRHIFPRLQPGTPISVEGLEHAVLAFKSPPSPLVVTARRGRTTTAIAYSLRSVHVDVARRRVRTVHGHSFSYPRERPPSSISVANAPEAAP